MKIKQKDKSFLAVWHETKARSTEVGKVRAAAKQLRGKLVCSEERKREERDRFSNRSNGCIML